MKNYFSLGSGLDANIIYVSGVVPETHYLVKLGKRFKQNHPDRKVGLAMEICGEQVYHNFGGTPSKVYWGNKYSGRVFTPNTIYECHPDLIEELKTALEEELFEDKLTSLS